MMHGHTKIKFSCILRIKEQFLVPYNFLGPNK